jgi:hypothetical protein
MPETEQRTLWDKVAHNLQDWYSDTTSSAP